MNDTKIDRIHAIPGISATHSRVASLVAVLLLLATPPTWGQQARKSREQTAGDVVALMRRALEVEPPPTVPMRLRRRLTQSEIKEYEDEYRKKPGLVFFQYPLAAEVDRDLYRDLKRWWKSAPHDQIRIAQDLAIEFGAAADPLQAMILHCLEEIDDRAIGVPDRAQVMEPVWFSVLSQAPSDHVQVEALDRIAGLRTLSEAGFTRLQGMASRPEGGVGLRAHAIRVLAGPWNEPGPPPSVDQYLLKVVAEDPSDECRMSAVSYFFAQRASRNEVIRVYVAALANALRNDDTRNAQYMMRVVAVQLRMIEAAPVLAIALRSSKPPVRAGAVNAFEKIAGIPPEESQKHWGLGIAWIILDRSHDDDDLAQLDKAVGVWLRWWAARGETLFQTGQLSALQAEARRVYEGAGDGQPGK